MIVDDDDHDDDGGIRRRTEGEEVWPLLLSRPRTFVVYGGNTKYYSTNAIEAGEAQVTRSLASRAMQQRVHRCTC